MFRCTSPHLSSDIVSTKLILTVARHLFLCVSAVVTVRHSSISRRVALRRCEHGASCFIFHVLLSFVCLCDSSSRFPEREGGCPEGLNLRLLGLLLLPPMLKGDGNQAPLGLCLAPCLGAFTFFLFFFRLFVCFVFLR